MQEDMQDHRAVLQLAARWAATEPRREVAVYLRLSPTTTGSTHVGTSEERHWNGVRLLDVTAFNPADEFGTLVVWRSLELLDGQIKAKLVVLDLHDMPRRHDMSPARLARVHRIMLKSKFQESALPTVASRTAISIIPNGVDEGLVAKIRRESRGEDRVCNGGAASSTGAGVVTALSPVPLRQRPLA